MAGLSLPVLGFPVGLSLGVRGEVVDELPTDLIGRLPGLVVLRGGGGEGGGHTRHGEDEPETLAFCPQLYPGTEPGEAACWELDRLV